MSTRLFSMESQNRFGFQGVGATPVPFYLDPIDIDFRLNAF